MNTNLLAKLQSGLVVIILLFFLPSRAEYYPIIFVHGINSHGSCEEGWKTWRYPNSALRRILKEHYRDYLPGSPLECNKETDLYPTGGRTRVIYSFSFYNPDGTRGVIGSNGKYWPCSYTDAYKASYQNGQWAKHLADFIDKVLEATGAEKVDVVAHSMGGLVVRAAIKWYEMPCGEPVKEG